MNVKSEMLSSHVKQSTQAGNLQVLPGLLVGSGCILSDFVGAPVLCMATAFAAAVIRECLSSASEVAWSCSTLHACHWCPSSAMLKIMSCVLADYISKAVGHCHRH